MRKVNLFGYEVCENGTILNLSGKPMVFNKTIDLSINGEVKSVSYARFVYYAFHQDFDFENHRFCVKHKDNNIENNAIENLYITNKKKHLRGENNSRAKLTNKEVEEIREKYFKNEIESRDESINNPFKKVSYRKLAEEYGVSHNLIKQIVKGECRKSG